MPLRTRPTSDLLGRTDLASRLFDAGADDYELYEDDGAFVLSIELPGYDPGDIDVRWSDGLLNVSAEHAAEGREKARAYHRRFRFPKRVVDEEIAASYDNGVLTVELPTVAAAADAGEEIPVEG